MSGVEVDVRWDGAAKVYVGRVIAMPAVVSQGRTQDEAIEATRSALVMYLNICSRRGIEHLPRRRPGSTDDGQGRGKAS